MARVAAAKKISHFSGRIMSAILLLLLQAFCLAPLPAVAGEVRLSVAASMTDAFKELAKTFHDAHPHITVIANYGSSGALAKQIVRGAPADLYVSANQKWMDYLLEQKKIAPQSVHVFANNVLVFVGQKGTGLRRLEDIASLALIAIGSPKSVPAGQYAAQALTTAGIYGQLAEDHKLVMAKDVRQALLYAERGEVDGAFVYQSDALLARNTAILLTVPAGYHDRIAYPLALTPDGVENLEAQAFCHYLKSPEAFAILATFGFTAAGD